MAPKNLFLLIFFLTTAFSLPDHEFIADVKLKTHSNNTVTSKTSITLIEGAYKFYRTTVRKDAAYFNCRNRKKGCRASGIASLLGDPNDANEYILDDISTKHTCPCKPPFKSLQSFTKSFQFLKYVISTNYQ